MEIRGWSWSNGKPPIPSWWPHNEVQPSSPEPGMGFQPSRVSPRWGTKLRSSRNLVSAPADARRSRQHLRECASDPARLQIVPQLLTVFTTVSWHVPRPAGSPAWAWFLCHPVGSWLGAWGLCPEEAEHGTSSRPAGSRVHSGPLPPMSPATGGHL